MRKVLYPGISSATPGGSTFSTALMAEEVNRTETYKSVAAIPGDGDIAEVFRSRGVPIHFYSLSASVYHAINSSPADFRSIDGLKGMWMTFRVALRVLRQEQPSVVHINTDRTLLPWGLAARCMGIPVVWHVRQMKGNSFVDPVRALIANYTIFISKATETRLSGCHVQRPFKIVPNVVDIAEFEPNGQESGVRTEIQSRNNSILIGFVGRLVQWKRPEWTLQAGIDLLKEGYNVEIVITGQDKGNYHRRFERMIQSNLPEERSRFHLLGYREDIPAIMQALDVFSLPSVDEPFGRVVIEAMAAGIPVVATEGGGVPEIIEDGVTGLLCNVDSYRGFVSQIRRLLDSEQLRSELVKAAEVRVDQDYSLSAATHRIIAVYDSLLQR